MGLLRHERLALVIWRIQFRQMKTNGRQGDSEPALTVFLSLPGCLVHMIAWPIQGELEDASYGSAGSPGRPGMKQT